MTSREDKRRGERRRGETLCSDGRQVIRRDRMSSRASHLRPGITSTFTLRCPNITTHKKTHAWRIHANTCTRYTNTHVAQ